VGAWAERRKQRKLARRIRWQQAAATPIDELTDDEMQDIEDEEQHRNGW
jgi:hypothetical protein